MQYFHRSNGHWLKITHTFVYSGLHIYYYLYHGHHCVSKQLISHIYLELKLSVCVCMSVIGLWKIVYFIYILVYMVIKSFLRLRTDVKLFLTKLYYLTAGTCLFCLVFNYIGNSSFHVHTAHPLDMCLCACNEFHLNLFVQTGVLYTMSIHLLYCVSMNKMSFISSLKGICCGCV